MATMISMSQMMEDLQDGCGGDAVVQAVITSSNTGLDSTKGSTKGVVDVRAWNAVLEAPLTAEILLDAGAVKAAAAAETVAAMPAWQPPALGPDAAALEVQQQQPGMPSAMGTTAASGAAPAHDRQQAAAPEQLRLMDLLLMDAPEAQAIPNPEPASQQPEVNTMQADGSSPGSSASEQPWQQPGIACALEQSAMELDTPFAYCRDLPFISSPDAEATRDSHAPHVIAAAVAAAAAAAAKAMDGSVLPAAAAGSSKAPKASNTVGCPAPHQEEFLSPRRRSGACSAAGGPGTACASPSASARTPNASHAASRQGSVQRGGGNFASPPAMQSSSKKPDTRCEPVSPTRCHSPLAAAPHQQAHQARRVARHFGPVGPYGYGPMPSEGAVPMMPIGYMPPHRHPHSMSQPHPLHHHHPHMLHHPYAMPPPHIVPPHGMYAMPHRLPSRFARPHPGAEPSASEDRHDTSRRSSASTAEGLPDHTTSAPRHSSGMNGQAAGGVASSASGGGALSHRAASSGQTGAAGCQQEADVQSTQQASCAHAQPAMGMHKYPASHAYPYPYPYPYGHPHPAHMRHPRSVPSRANSSMPDLDSTMPPRHPHFPSAAEAGSASDSRMSGPPLGTQAASAPRQPHKRALADRDRDLLAPSHSAPAEAFSQGQFGVDPDKPDEGWMAANLCYKRFAKDGAAISLSEPMVAELTEELRQLHALCVTRHLARSGPGPASSAPSSAPAAPPQGSVSMDACGPAPSGAAACGGPERSTSSLSAGAAHSAPDWLHVRTSTGGAGPGPGPGSFSQPSPGKKRDSAGCLSTEVVESPIKRQRPHRMVSNSMTAGVPYPAPFHAASISGMLPQQQSVPASWAPHAARHASQQQQGEAGPGQAPPSMCMPVAPRSPSRTTEPPASSQAWAALPHRASQPAHWLPSSSAPLMGARWPAHMHAPASMQASQGVQMAPMPGGPGAGWLTAGGALCAGLRSGRRSTADSADAMDSFLNALLDTQDDVSTLPPTPALPVP